jgi:hypothetical protein
MPRFDRGDSLTICTDYRRATGPDMVDLDRIGQRVSKGNLLLRTVAI